MTKWIGQLSVYGKPDQRIEFRDAETLHNYIDNKFGKINVTMEWHSESVVVRRNDRIVFSAEVVIRKRAGEAGANLPVFLPEKA